MAKKIDIFISYGIACGNQIDNNIPNCSFNKIKNLLKHLPYAGLTINQQIINYTSLYLAVGSFAYKHISTQDLVAIKGGPLEKINEERKANGEPELGSVFTEDGRAHKIIEQLEKPERRIPLRESSYQKAINWQISFGILNRDTEKWIKKYPKLGVIITKKLDEIWRREVLPYLLQLYS